jgi:P27 family predicted phage terminase small subunit
VKPENDDFVGKMARGRPRKPSEQRELEGKPGHRPIPNSPKYPLLNDEPPSELGPDGRELWERITTANGTNGILQETDYPDLLAMCMEWDLYRRAMRSVNETDTSFLVQTKGHSDASPNLVRNPARVIAQGAFDRFDKLAARFGLTPVDRTRLDSGPEGEEMDPVAAARRGAQGAVKRKPDK